MNQLELAIAAARSAPSADNSQPWRFQWDGRSLSVSHRPHLGVDPFGAAGHATLLGIGAVAENLSQTHLADDDSLSIGDLVHGQPYFSYPITSPETPAAQPDLPLFNRHTYRLPFQRGQQIDGALVAALTAMREPETRLVLLQTPTQLKAYSNIVRACSLARFCDQELHEWLMGSLRFSDDEVARGDGLDVATLHLPPGGKQFMKFIRPWSRMARLNRWGIHHVMALAEAMPIRQSGMVVAVIGADSAEGAFSAGRLMERAWIEMNQCGWAAHPYYVVADQQTRLANGRVPAAWRHRIERALDDLNVLLSLAPGERLHISLRVGRPKSPVRRSLRLPTGALLSDTIG